VAPQQRQQHHQAEEIAQELCLERVELLRQAAHQCVQDAEHQPRCARPQQALDRGVEAAQTMPGQRGAALQRAAWILGWGRRGA
jgi:hypothetical protein